MMAMARFPLFLPPLAVVLLAPPLWPVAALAQLDPAAQKLIERLQIRPGQDTTRGIKLPGASAPAVSAPSLTPAAPPVQQEAVMARPAAPPRPAPVETTAPTGVPAVSITVQFASGSAELSDAAERALAPLGQALNSATLAPYRFRIEGHTDTVGGEALNRELSQRRSEAVRDYLVRRHGVQPERLEAVGLGKSQLLVATADNVPEHRNRRVQVLNLGN